MTSREGAALAARWPPKSGLIDAADLLAQPDPGPTPWLVEGLIVDQVLIAAVGRWKTTKSYGLLDICISIATGRPAFGVAYADCRKGRRLRRHTDDVARVDRSSGLTVALMAGGGNTRATFGVSPRDSAT